MKNQITAIMLGLVTIALAASPILAQVPKPPNAAQLPTPPEPPDPPPEPGAAVSQLLAAEDNLVRGASGVAVQNFNRMHGWDERTGLQ